MSMQRRNSKKIWIGEVPIGNDAPISIQSMTNTDTRDKEATIKQILALQESGCEIVRLAVIDEDAAVAMKYLVAHSPIPVIADIHFDHTLAIKALEAGVHGLRINPGNIGSKEKIKKVIDGAKERLVPIRIGVNSGSVEKDLLEKHHGPSVEAMVESALRHIAILEELNYDEIKVSIKSTDVASTIAANRILAGQMPYPIHVGVTEAGLSERAIVKSAIGIGTLLSEGIGDTIRVSLTGSPLDEISVAKNILAALDLRIFGPTLISCPTCGRTQMNLIETAKRVEEMLTVTNKPIKVAVMGCAVNGPGEAREADLGIAGGKGLGLIFRKGKIIKKVKQEQLIEAFKEELDKLLKEME